MGKNVYLSFPFRVSNQGGLAKSDAFTPQHIEDNITQIIATRKGERVMLPNYGTDIPKVLFEGEGNEALINIVLYEMCEVIREFEPRVEINPENISYYMEGSTLNLVIQYTIIANGLSNSFAVQI